MTIYVGNLSFQAEQEDLLDLFGQYGEVKQCSLPLDRETGRKRGFAFVEMSNDADEQKAIDDLQDVGIDGPLSLNILNVLQAGRTLEEATCLATEIASRHLKFSSEAAARLPLGAGELLGKFAQVLNERL